MSREFDRLYISQQMDELNSRQSLDALPVRPWPGQWHPSEDFPTPQSVGSDPFRQVANDALSFDPKAAEYRIGDPHLPVAPYREHFVRSVSDNQSIIVSSETGSGKSSQLGLYLMEAGYPRIFVTSPRILAARELKERAQYTLGTQHASLAGYLTGNQDDSEVGPDTRLVYVTEQLLFKMANRGMLKPTDVVINDEAHERTTATVVLLGLLKDMMQEPAYEDMRLVVSSATIDTAKFAQYLANPENGEAAPVLILPGRTYPIEAFEAERSVAQVAKAFIKGGHNVLAFEPGLTRMQNTWTSLKTSGRNEEVHMLHGDLSPREQTLALNPDDHNHIVANKVGETSLTPQGKDVVVDSGLSNIGGYEAGVHVLETVHSSQATIMQRQGRIGRTMPGTYVLATPDDAPPAKPIAERDEYDRPDIESSSVASYVAELLSQGRRLEDLQLLEEPTTDNLQYDYTLLHRLGAVEWDDSELQLTDVGRSMINLPLDSQYARMLVAARQRVETDGAESEVLLLQVAAVAAIQQVNGILDVGQHSKRRYLRSQRHEQNLSSEQDSDVLFELDAFTSMFAKHQEILASDAENLEEKFEMLLHKWDIHPNRYYKALRTLQELCRREDLDIGHLRQATNMEREAILGCQIKATEEAFVQKNRWWYRDIRGESRRLGRRSTITSDMAQLVVGAAFDRRSLTRGGRLQKRFVAGGSVVTLDQLVQNAPERISRSYHEYGLKGGRIVQRQALFFDQDLYLDDVLIDPSPTRESREFIIHTMMTGKAVDIKNPSLISEYETGTSNASHALRQFAKACELDHRSRANLRVNERYSKLIQDTIKKSLEMFPLDVIDPEVLDEVIPRVYVNALIRPTKKKDIPSILQASPDGISLHIAEDEKEYVPVTYRNGVAYVTVPKYRQYDIRREDFANLEEHHPVKLRLGGRQYIPLDGAFEKINEAKNSPARLRRLQRREEAGARALATPFQEGKVVKIQRGRAKDYSEMAPMPSFPMKKRYQGRSVKSRREPKVKRAAEEAIN